MKRQLLILLTVFLFAACSDHSGRNQNAASLPEAMQETRPLYKSSRSYSSPVNRIYYNLLDKSPELKRIDDESNDLSTEKSDSAAAVNEYLGTINNYYRSAEEHVKQIKDSILRQKIWAVINSSRSSFDSQAKPYKSMLDTIDRNIRSVNDRREMLKVMVTLPVIQDYQKNNKPSVSPLDNFNRQLEKRKLTLDSVIKKHGG